MLSELRKLANLLRKMNAEYKTNRFVKCAQVVQAATALAILRRKIG